MADDGNSSGFMRCDLEMAKKNGKAIGNASNIAT